MSDKLDTQRVYAFIRIASAVCEVPVRSGGVWAFETPSHGQEKKKINTSILTELSQHCLKNEHIMNPL